MQTVRTMSCEVCDATFETSPHRKSRWAVAGAGAIIGGTATESLLGALLLGGASYLLASAADQYYFSRRCPRCGSLGEPMHDGRGERPAEAPPTETERPH